LRLVLSEPLSESGRFITWDFSSLVYSQESLHQPFDLGVSQETIDERREKGSKTA